jgi:hypothetical protein
MKITNVYDRKNAIFDKKRREFFDKSESLDKSFVFHDL